MATDQLMRKCKKCKRKTLHIKNGKPSFLENFALIVFTLGIGFIILVIREFWRDIIGYYTPACTVCGTKNQGIFGGLFD